MFATPAVGMPLTQTCDGASSMNLPVQSPAREIVSRKPGSPGDGHVGERVPLAERVAADRGRRAGERRDAVVEPRERDVGGRHDQLDRHPRSRSHGSAMLNVTTARTQVCRARPATARCRGPGRTVCGPEQDERRPAAEPVHDLERVVPRGAERAARHRRRPARSTTELQRDHRMVGIDIQTPPAQLLLVGGDRERQEPQRAGERAADVEPAEVVDLRASVRGPAAASSSARGWPARTAG